MKDRLKLIAGNLIITLVLLLALETVFYLIRPKEYRNVGFLINIKQTANHLEYPGYGLTEIDPLLGYNKSAGDLMQQGFKVDNGCVVLSTTDDTSGITKILITGGSAADISLHTDSWPVAFVALLKRHGIKARVYIGAVGGHNSGQELLKLMRDGLATGPLVHISYSGGSEIENASYVSKYEQAFYEKEFSRANTSWLLPNTVLFMRNLLRMNHPDVVLLPNKPMSPVKFWERNMSLMHSVAVEYQYNFIGILQPVDSIAKNTSAGDFKKYYPEMSHAVMRHPDYLVDLSNTLNKVVITETGNEATPQQAVAYDIYDILMQKKLLEK